MRGLWLALMVLIGPGMASAAPEPPPAAGFGGAQYIDGRGCVFTRMGGGWQARLDPAGRPLCGFPPSAELRRLDPDTAHVLPPDVPPAPPDPAQMLADQLAEELRNADMTGEALPVPTPPAGAAANPLMEEIAKTLAHQGAVRSALGQGGRIPDQLCARLGYRTGPVEGGVADATGFCPGLRPPAPGHSFGDATRKPPAAAARIAAAPAAAPASAAASRPASGTDRPRQPPQQPPRPGPASTARTAPGGQAAPAAAPAPAPAREVEMIPASARYVQIGVFQDEASVEAAIRALARTGLPMAQGRNSDSASRAVMAGPFADRGRLIEVLNRLRAQGWPRAVAR